MTNTSRSTLDPRPASGPRPRAVVAERPNALANPDAGNHPLPSDEREIAAVLRAGRRCYAAHPYFAQRYGARGVAFTRSDGGYLVTLVRRPKGYVETQVTWLAGVLASRGMPSWLLEIHLDLLHEELCAAIPGRQASYRKLQQAAGLLRAARQAWIAEAEFTALAASFAANAGGDLANAGGLVVAAVCDECSGLVEAVPSLTAWLADAGRFPPRWCAAVAETLAQARAAAAQRRGALP